MTGKFFFAAAAALSLLTGCNSAKAEKEDRPPAPAELISAERESMKDTGIQWGENILNAVRDGNYEQFTAHFAPRLKAQFSKEAFDGSRKIIGNLENWQYLTRLSTPMFETYVWKVQVARKAGGEGKADAMFRGEILMRLTLLKENGELQVAGCIFD